MRVTPVTLLCIILSAGTTFVVLGSAGPTTNQLDGDIRSAEAQLNEANSEVAKYSGGIIKMEAQLRAAVLKNTVAMLEQKKESLIRGVTIVYRDPSTRGVTQDAEKNEAELRRAIADALEAHQEAEQYTGGLIRSMALVREATAKVTEASVEQRIELTRAGIPQPTFGETAAKRTPPSPGSTSTDKDAL